MGFPERARSVATRQGVGLLRGEPSTPCSSCPPPCDPGWEDQEPGGTGRPG